MKLLEGRSYWIDLDKIADRTYVASTRDTYFRQTGKPLSKVVLAKYSLNNLFVSGSFPHQFQGKNFRMFLRDRELQAVLHKPRGLLTFRRAQEARW